VDSAGILELSFQLASLPFQEVYCCFVRLERKRLLFVVWRLEIVFNTVEILICVTLGMTI
jgi:hypothetical protein